MQVIVVFLLATLVVATTSGALGEGEIVGIGVGELVGVGLGLAVSYLKLALLN